MRSLLLVLAGDRPTREGEDVAGVESRDGRDRGSRWCAASGRPRPAAPARAATSETTSRLRKRRCPAEEPRLPSFNVSCRSVTETCRAGASPKTIPVRSETPRVKASTQPSTPMFSMRGRPPGTAASTACVPQRAMASPAMPPASANTTLSVSSWRTTRPRAGAECDADGDLLLAPGEAGQQQVRHVGAGDEEHEADRAQQNQQGGANVSDDRAGERRDLDAVPGIRLRVGFGQARRDGGHFRLRLGPGHAGLEPPHCTDAGMHFARPGQDIVPLLQERVDVGLAFELKPGGNDARDGVAPAVERELRSRATAGLEPKRRLHRPPLMRTTGAAPSRSSAASKSRPARCRFRGRGRSRPRPSCH